MTTYRTKRLASSSGRRYSTATPSSDLLAIDRRVYLPFDLATMHAAAQNFRMDVVCGIHRYLDEWEENQSSYLSDALAYMKEDGCNMYHEDSDEPWIQVDRSFGIVPMPSNRAQILLALFGYVFAMNDSTLLRSEYYPCPRIANSGIAIQTAMDRFQKAFCHH
jgi:hypothetical protein